MLQEAHARSSRVEKQQVAGELRDVPDGDGGHYKRPARESRIRFWLWEVLHGCSEQCC